MSDSGMPCLFSTYSSHNALTPAAVERAISELRAEPQASGSAGRSLIWRALCGMTSVVMGLRATLIRADVQAAQF